MEMTLKGKRFLNKVTRGFWIVEDEYGVPANTAYFDTEMNLVTGESMVVLRNPNDTYQIAVDYSATNWNEFKTLTLSKMTGSIYILEEAHDLLEAIIYHYSK